MFDRVVDPLASGSAPAETAIFLAGGNITALNSAAVIAKAASFFEPYRFGAASLLGVEKIVRACIEEHWTDDDFGVLKVDMKPGNYAEHFPKCLPWLEDVGVVNLQAALTLLHLCGCFCKLVHFSRATPILVLFNTGLATVHISQSAPHAVSTELRKHKANDPKCNELGCKCIPMVIESYGT
eukprot:Em0020g231a